MLEAHDTSRYAKAAAHLSRLQTEVLSVYRPTVQQEPFHQCDAREIILRGGKRSGKSTAAAVAFASRVMGQSIIGLDGKHIPLHYQVSKPDDPKTYWIIGWAVDHIGQTLYRLLFEPGQRGRLRIIKNAQQQWEMFNRNNPDHAARAKESRLAPPLIPPRMIVPKSWSFESRAGNVFEKVELVNGATIYAFPSSSQHPKQGDAVAGIWIDEDIQHADHLEEWQDRLTDEDGWLIWSVWPHVANHALIAMLDRADSAEDDPKANIRQFQLRMTQNPYFTEEAKERSLERMGDDDSIARRDAGELLWESMMMYDFAPAMHVIKSKKAEGRPRDAYEYLADLLETKAVLPQSWTRYMAIDPSHTRTAVLVGVVPPPDGEIAMGNRLIIESEYIGKRQSADELAQALAGLYSGLHFEAFVMDQNAGRQTAAGRSSGDTNFSVYSRAFQKAGLRSRITEHGFIPGCNQTQKRYQLVRELMLPQHDGWPGLLLVERKTWTTRDEFHTYRKKHQKIAGEKEIMLDEPANPRKHDAMAALEYLVAYLAPFLQQGTAYVPPEHRSAGGSGAYRAAMAMRQRLGESEYVHLGPGVAA